MMYGIIFIISLLISLLVILGGFFLLAYSKKEGLGKLTKLASYVAIIFGTLIFVGGLVKVSMHGSCGDGKCGKGEMECHKEMRMECHKEMMNGAHCEKNAMEGCCKNGMTGCADHCKKNGSESCCKEGKGECSESKCEGMEAEHCKKDGKDCCKEEATKKVVTK